MEDGEQMPGLSFAQHGLMVYKRFKDLIGSRTEVWRLPDWFIEHEEFILKELAPHLELISQYQIWHDCGKPFCRTVDAEGKVHYPDHANISANIWLSLGGDQKTAELIRDDMRCHLLRPADAKQFSKHPNALILLITALCELHANATMFGGIQSDGFKIKFKRLDKCGNIILSELTKE